jgi:hypothetical protein
MSDESKVMRKSKGNHRGKVMRDKEKASFLITFNSSLMTFPLPGMMALL